MNLRLGWLPAGMLLLQDGEWECLRKLAGHGLYGRARE